MLSLVKDENEGFFKIKMKMKASLKSKQFLEF